LAIDARMAMFRNTMASLDFFSGEGWAEAVRRWWRWS